MATKKKLRAKKKFSARKAVRSIARERVGNVKASRVIVPKSERKSKYKADPRAGDDAES